MIRFVRLKACWDGRERMNSSVAAKRDGLLICVGGVKFESYFKNKMKQTSWECRVRLKAVSLPWEAEHLGSTLSTEQL